MSETGRVLGGISRFCIGPHRPTVRTCRQCLRPVARTGRPAVVQPSIAEALTRACARYPMSVFSLSSLLCVLSVLGLGMAMTPAQAQGGAPLTVQTAAASAAGNESELENLAGQWLQPTIASVLGQEASGALRPELILGRLDPRLRLAPCQRVEPYIPPGTRLWGRSRIGLRCLEGVVRWNVFLPVTVRAWGPAWVLRRPVAAGAVLTQEDADIAEIDWAEQHAAVLADTDKWVGQQAAYALAAGQALRQNMVRPVPSFGPGTQVRVASQGNGFRVTVTGEALAAGIEGQQVKVRLKGGRIVTGTVKEDQTVEVRL